MRDVVIVEAVRTPIGKRGGGLSTMHSADLLAVAQKAGSTGAVLVTKAVAELERSDGELALVTMCCGGGLGTGTIL